VPRDVTHPIGWSPTEIGCRRGFHLTQDASALIETLPSLLELWTTRPTSPLHLHSFRPVQVCAQTPGVVVSFMFRFNLQLRKIAVLLDSRVSVYVCTYPWI
jgi:hypothetical protein